LRPSLDGLRREVEPMQEVRRVRAGIEPLDDDPRQVPESEADGLLVFWLSGY